MEETSGLFGAEAGNAAATAAVNVSGAKRQKADKRMMLRPWDTAAAQVLNPYGCSTVKDTSQADLWKAVAEGSAKAYFHTELAATNETGGNYRVGVGISRMVEPILAAIEELRKPSMAQLIQELPLQAAKAEAEQLEPLLKTLYAGKGSQPAAENKATGFSRIRKDHAKQKDAPKYSQQDLENAARGLHEWLSKPTSPLRAIMSFLSAGGVFYTANVAEKVGRAWVAHKPASAGDAAAAAVARASGAGAPVDAGLEDDTKGLFEA